MMRKGRVLRPEHPIFHDPSWALIDALVDDGVHGRSPSDQVGPILRHLDSLGWRLVRDDAVKDDQSDQVRDDLTIVRELGGDRCPFDLMEECWFCGLHGDLEEPSLHSEDCAWRRAVEWVEAHPEQTR